MSRAEWKRVEELFHAALPLPAAERAAFLNRSCDDPQLREKVIRLLESAPEAFDYFSQPLLSAEFDALLQIHDRIGPYRLIRELGRGGMGRVFLAERADDQFRKLVAVKVMGAATAVSRESRQQFLRERQILANLEHPGIARLLDGGLIDGEVPYIVMEYVDGEPLNAYVSNRSLGIRQRLELFLQVCEAVEYAHGSLVIHRDLKPANILVTPDGQIKLLDFGVARLLDAGVADPTVTWMGFRQVTPQYASPELLQGDPAGTASDVYSLGILLFELLVGRPPYSVRNLTPLETEKVVCQETPPLCSETARKEASRKDAENRRAAIRLAKTLKGDLDNIAAQAIRKRPERRYRSVRELANDVSNFLNGRPVAARPSTWSYRASKFVKRHTGGVAAAALLLMALLGGIVATSWQARVATQERNRAEQSLQLLIDLVRISDPDRGVGADIPARKLLDHAYGELQRRLPEDSEVRSEVTQAIGEIYGQMGLGVQAEAVLQAAHASRLRLYGPADHRTLDSLKAWAKATAGVDPERAEPMLQEALSRRRAVIGSNHLAVAQDLVDLGGFYVRIFQADPQKLQLARSLLLEALEIRRNLLTDPHEGIAEVLFMLANVMGEGRKVELLQEALAMYVATVGENDNRVANTMNDLALALEEEGELEQALSMMERSASLHEELLGLEHPRTLTLINNLAGVHRDQGRLEAAEPLYRKVLEVKDRMSVEKNAAYAHPLYGLGRVLMEKGEAVEAERLLLEAVEILSRYQNPIIYNIALSTLGECLLLQGRISEARPLIAESLPVLEEYFEEGNPELVRARNRVERLHSYDQDVQTQQAAF
ncbi:MAG TPA: serine/threonine-protein kinase [Acidobacteriota bacterium]|nr:serine/threonine-protein kinase [Acidobacteriota bacterium]